jgi:peptidoglycan/xylan/chitin deacetylase (PgdA/CDA1 family)
MTVQPSKFDDLLDVPAGNGMWVREAGVLAWKPESDFVSSTDARLTDQRVPIDNSVTSAKIADGTIVDADLAADTLTARVIAANAIGTSELADAAVDTAAIVDGAITAPKFAAGAVQAALGGSITQATSVALPRQRHLKPTVWTAFQSSHGWTTGGSGVTWNLNDTTKPYAGSQSVSFLTGAGSGTSWVQSIGGSSRDLSASDITVWVWIDSGLSHFRKITVYLTSDSLTNYVDAGVYNFSFPATPKNPIRQGEWFPLRFNYQQLAANGGTSGSSTTGSPVNTAITGMRISVQDDGAGAVTGYIGAVTYQARPSTFPNGVVSLTFDDTKAAAWTIAAPYMAKYGYSGTEYAIVDLVGTAGSMTLAQLQALESQYGWEVAGHAYTVADHDTGFDALSSSALETDLALDKLWLIQNGFRGYDHMAYPLGNLAPTDQQVGKYFATGRTLYSNPSTEMVRPGSSLRLRSYEVLSTITSGNVTAQIDAAYAAGAWLILCFHGIVASGATGSDTTTTIFQAVVDYINTKGIECAPVGDVWRSMA